MGTLWPRARQISCTFVVNNYYFTTTLTGAGEQPKSLGCIIKFECNWCCVHKGRVVCPPPSLDEEIKFCFLSFSLASLLIVQRLLILKACYLCCLVVRWSFILKLSSCEFNSPPSPIMPCEAYLIRLNATEAHTPSRDTHTDAQRDEIRLLFTCISLHPTKLL